MDREQVTDCIPFGKENAISISELQDLTGFTNRGVRRMIERARKEETSFVIVSSAHFKGYYKTTYKTEIQEFVKEQTRRAIKTLYNLKSAKKFLGEVDQFKIVWESEKPIFKLENYPGKVVMHCNTAEKADIFCWFLHYAGRKWFNGEKYAENTAWDIIEERTCYDFNRGFFGLKGRLERENYKVLEFDDFKWEEEL